jgi:hypothetical protein
MVRGLRETLPRGPGREALPEPRADTAPPAARQLRDIVEAQAAPAARRPATSLQLPVPAEARGRWARLIVEAEGVSSPLFAFAVTGYGSEPSPPIGFELFERRGRRGTRRFVATRFVPHEATRIEVELLGTGSPDGLRAAARLQVLPRWRAALTLIQDRPGGAVALAGALRGHSPRAWPAALRRALAAPPQPGRGEAEDYATWVELFDRWTPADFPANDALRIGALVFAPPAAPPEALRQTLDSLAAQFQPAAAVALADEAAAPRLPAGEYLALLEAGEVLPHWALALAAREIASRRRPEIVIADEDRLTPDGRRREPHFKPEPNRLLMLSGALAGGLWLVRRDVAERLGLRATGSAQAARLDLWLRLNEASGATGERLPFILCHRGPPAPPPPPELAQVAEAHLRRVGSPFAAEGAAPGRLRLRTGRAAMPVDILVPSGLRRPHVRHCLGAILRETKHAGVVLRIGVGQPGPLAPDQREMAARLQALGARVEHLPMPGFNFAAAINRLAAMGEAEGVLLLNDDVAPLRPDWLAWMTAHLHDPGIAAVGARLLYPNGRVQHGGVLMGLGGLCEHAHRGLRGDEPGHGGRAVLAQELSAVTGACMLVRRSAFEALGGLDEGYPSAFNDIDFCLRLREAGHGIAYAPEAELTHHELQTYRSHYRGERAPFEAEETARMRRRWAAVIAADPFHNPNLRLETGLEGRPAFPPRRAVPPG